MERDTWREIFWDAYIRFRLACRRLYRTYWPPQVKAWQVCTATGVASIVLTILVLNLPAKAGSPGKSLPPAAASKLKPEAPDPFADTEVASLSEDVVNEVQAGPPTQTVNFDPDAEEPVVPRKKSTAKNSVATESPDEQVLPQDAPSRKSSVLGTEDVAESTTVNESDLAADDTTDGFEPTLAKQVPPAQEDDGQPLTGPNSEFGDFTPPFGGGRTYPGPEAASSAAEESDAGEIAQEPEMTADTEEKAANDPPAVSVKNQVPPIRHNPLVSDRHPKGHYARLGQHEDAEEDRHSVQDIRPTRTDNVAFPGAKVGNIAIEPAKPSTPELEPPVEAEKPVDEPQLAEPAANGSRATEPVDPGPQPPVLFAPDQNAESETAGPTTPRTKYHGPARSTEASDHEGHQEEDQLFSNTPAKIGTRVVHPAKPVDEAAPRVEQHGRIHSTEATDHEAHQEEDLLFSNSHGKGARRIDPPAESVDQAPPQAERHGRIHSTEATDHEAHQEEDQLLSNTPTKGARRLEQPAEPVQQPPRPAVHPGRVHSTEASDHEGHVEEDSFSNSPDKAAPKLEVPETAVEPPATPDVEQPALETPVESLKPEEAPVTEETPATEQAPVTEEAPITEEAPVFEEAPVPDEATPRPSEPATEEVVEPMPPQTSKRTAPRVINHIDEEVKREPAVEKPGRERDPVAPMEMPDEPEPAASERISVPERVPVEETIDSAPPQDSEFTVARPPAKGVDTPKLVMEITGPKQVPLGTQVVMHFKVQNVGTLPVEEIVVNDVLPAGMQHKLSPDLEYVIPRLEPGQSRETNLTVQCVTMGTITNKATLRAAGDVTTEAVIAIEVVKASTRRGTAPPPPESPLVMRHHGPERWLIDSTGQFLITVTNPSNQTLQNVTITQAYPQGTNVVHATVGHKIDTKAHTVSWTISEFGPGVSYILETELHSQTTGPTTSVARIKVGTTEVAQDRWTAVSYGAIASKPGR